MISSWIGRAVMPQGSNAREEITGTLNGCVKR
jgi:hypothetical protein